MPHDVHMCGVIIGFSWKLCILADLELIMWTPQLGLGLSFLIKVTTFWFTVELGTDSSFTGTTEWRVSVKILVLIPRYRSNHGRNCDSTFFRHYKRRDCNDFQSCWGRRYFVKQKSVEKRCFFLRTLYLDNVLSMLPPLC